MKLSSLVLTSHYVSASVHDARCSTCWKITRVYGSEGILKKKMGDFNLISSTRDKNNGRVNRAMINRFQKAINHMQVRKLNLLGKKFTWSNQQPAPTLTRIDKMFCTPGWENLYDKPTLQALSSSTPDHCPLLVSYFSPPRSRPKFRFESFWVNMLNFKDVVSEA
jgi:hypothetical protein